MLGRNFRLSSSSILTARRSISVSAVRMGVRSESDAFGPIEVDSSRYWGAQTQRSLQNFPIGGPEAKMPLEIIKGACTFSL
jgi:fumarate hydratase, class II